MRTSDNIVDAYSLCQKWPDGHCQGRDILQVPALQCQRDRYVTLGMHALPPLAALALTVHLDFYKKISLFLTPVVKHPATFQSGK